MEFDERNAHNLIQLLRYERYLTRLWEHRGITWDDHEPAVEKLPDEHPAST